MFWSDDTTGFACVCPSILYLDLDGCMIYKIGFRIFVDH